MTTEAVRIKRKMYDYLIRLNTQYPDHWTDVDNLIKAFSKEEKAREYVDELIADGYAKRDGYQIAAVIGNDLPDVKAWLAEQAAKRKPGSST